MTYSIVQKSELEGALRLDAEYYQAEYLELANVAALSGLTTLAQLDVEVDTSAFYPSIAEYYREEGIPFIRVADVTNLQLLEDNLLFLPYDIVKKFTTIQIGKPGDIVITKGGTVGNVAILPENYEEYALSRDIIVIKTSKLIKDHATTILLFLDSKLGRFQMLRGASQQIQPHLTLPLIRNLKVSKTAINEAVSLYESALKESRNSKKLYSQAEGVLLEELGLKDFELDDDLYNIVNFSEVQATSRMDAEYFQPKYEKLIAKIKSQKAKLLGELVSMKKGVEPGSEVYEEDGKLFIRVSNITKQGFVDGNQKYLTHELCEKLKKDYQPRVGEILLTKDATPGIAYVIKEEIKGIISGGILRLKLKEDMEPEYLALCINSIVGQLQAERDAGGSVIKHWKPEEIRRVAIPILPKKPQQKIAKLARQSHESRKRAKELLEEAKHKVEELIEAKNG